MIKDSKDKQIAELRKMIDQSGSTSQNEFEKKVRIRNTFMI